MSKESISCIEKQKALAKAFEACLDSEKKYLKIIEFGRSLPLLKEGDRIEEDRIRGCQSLLYLKTEELDQKLFFTVHSDALISLGLAALLIFVYSGETAETILKCPPSFAKEIGIPHILTPGRLNGFQSLYVRMQRDALAFLKVVSKNSSMN